PPPPATVPPAGTVKTPSQPAPDRGAFGGLWVVPFATHHFQGAGWDGGYHGRWISGQYRVGLLQNGYEPVSGSPALTLQRVQQFFLEVELDARCRFYKTATLALGGG